MTSTNSLQVSQYDGSSERSSWTVRDETGPRGVITSSGSDFEAIWRIRTEDGLTTVTWKYFPTLEDAVSHLQNQEWVPPIL